MATPEILDFAQLLRPISEALPAGPELKEDDRLRSVYQTVKDARETARIAEKRLRDTQLGGEKSEIASCDRPDWKRVYDLSVDALSQHSKDLWIAAWLIESLARLQGFAGLRDGFRLARELAEKFWDGIHPHPDEEGYSTTVAQLTGLNGDDSEGALIAPIDQIPITVPGALRALTSADYKQAVKLNELDSEKRAQRVESGAISLEMFEKSVREGSPEYYANLLEDLQQAIDEFFLLGEALDSRCGKSPDGGPAAPPTSAIRGALTDVRETVQNLTKDILGVAASEEDQTAGQEASNTATSDATSKSSKQGMTREDAFRQLQGVAEFFRRTEPHSPISYALEQAVRWGRMSLPQLLNELINDSAARDDLFKRVGLPRQESE